MKSPVARNSYKFNKSMIHKDKKKEWIPLKDIVEEFESEYPEEMEAARKKVRDLIDRGE